jgi:hypothetical protein
VLENLFKTRTLYDTTRNEKPIFTIQQARNEFCPLSRPQLTSLGCQPRATVGGGEGAPHLFYTHAVVMHMLAKRTEAAGVGAGAGGAHERGDGQGRGVVEAPPRPAAKR